MKTLILQILFTGVLLASFKSIAQAIPTLGLASTYGIFTGVGAINISGATIINGDVGTNAGLYTLNPPGIINGQIHNIDPVSLTVKTAVSDAYMNFGNILCDTTLAVGLGNGQLLTSKAYCLGSANTLNGNLILDGNNDTGAIFIFKINGAFATSVASTITTINGASLSNVYWIINGQVDLGANSTFGGTLLVDGGSLNLASGVKLFGRGLVLSGDINISNSTVNVSGVIPLSVSLTNFQASLRGSRGLLQWTTTNETGTKNFIIERSRSTNDASWETVSTIEPKGNPGMGRYYEAIDSFAGAGLIFYRLKITDNSGNYTYSQVRKLLFNRTISISLVPNPVVNEFTLTQMTTNKGSGECLVWDITGRIYARFSLSHTIKVSAINWPSGTYFLKIGEENIIKIEKL